MRRGIGPQLIKTIVQKLGAYTGYTAKKHDFELHIDPFDRGPLMLTFLIAYFHQMILTETALIKKKSWEDFINVLGRSCRGRRLSTRARNAGLIWGKPLKAFFSHRRTTKLEEKQGPVKDVLIIGSTGFRTFVDPKGDLYQVMQNCRTAKIMLLNPFSEGARVRAKSILDSHVTLQTFRGQVERSIVFLKGLKAVKKDVKLKLYRETPLLKLVILDDDIWIQHYRAGRGIQRLPEYVFKHDPYLGSLYTPFYQYFMTRWNDPNVSEYDLDADVLIYRDIAGNEIRRERYDREADMAPINADDHLSPKHGHGYPSHRVICPLRQSRRALACADEGFKNVW